MSHWTEAELRKKVRSVLDGRRPLRVVQAGDPVLRTPALRYEGQLPESLLHDLLDAMRAHLPGIGVGLAAPQIGIPLAIAVIEDPAEVSPAIAVARERAPQPVLELINPEVTPIGDELAVHYEGCLSVEGWAAAVARHRRIELRTTDRHGEQLSMELSGWSARIAQHETDHLAGVLYLDRAEIRSLSSISNRDALWNDPTPMRAAAELGFALGSTAASTAVSPRTLLDDTDPAALFTPVDVAGLKLRNRFVMAPMTRRFSPAGVPDKDVAAYYARRASSLGLIVTEGTYVDEPSAGSSSRVPRLYGEHALTGWRRVVDAVHAEGGLILPQLWHLGADRRAGAPPVHDAPVVSPSGVDGTGRAIGEPAGSETIEEVVASFVRAAVDAQQVGFDGIELHGAHGYLLDQFHWEATNRRIDGYGVDVAGRVRLSAEVVGAIRDAVGPTFPIAFRFSQWKGTDYDAQIASDPDELAAFLTPLADAGVSLFDVSTRRYWQPAFDGSARTLAGWTKHLTGRPVIALGSVGVAAPFLGGDDQTQQTLSLAPLVRLLEQGEIDLVGVGRAVLADPEWAGKLAEGRPGDIRPYSKAVESILR